MRSPPRVYPAARELEVVGKLGRSEGRKEGEEEKHPGELEVVGIGTWVT